MKVECGAFHTFAFSVENKPFFWGWGRSGIGLEREQRCRDTPQHVDCLDYMQLTQLSCFE